MTSPVRPRIASSIDELIAGATDRVDVHPDDGKSGAQFESLRIDGVAHFLKVLSYEGDWIMRCSGNTDHWEYKAWRAGLYHRAPPEVDHAMVAMALDHTGATPRLAMLMRDVSASLIPEGDAPITTEVHDAFMDHMAAFHAAYWGWTDDVGLSSIEQRVAFFSDANVAREKRASDPPVPIKVAEEGWALLPERAPELARVVNDARAHPSTLADQLRALPRTFIMGDWKLGNLGHHADGRSVVVDWAYPGEAPGCWDLAWYLALNRARNPRSKEESIAAYRAGLERRGVDTQGWFDDQLSLCLLGAMTMIGWEKAVGDADELGWWEEAVVTTGGAGRTAG
jgi:hypothetical protein